MIVTARTVKRSAVGAAEFSEPSLPKREGAIIGRIVTEINKKSHTAKEKCWSSAEGDPKHAARHFVRFAEADTRSKNLV